jgi:hypothetical protein
LQYSVSGLFEKKVQIIFIEVSLKLSTANLKLLISSFFFNFSKYFSIIQSHFFILLFSIFTSSKILKSTFLHFLTEKFSIGEVIIVSFGIFISCQFESVITKYIIQISFTVQDINHIFILSQILKGLFKIILTAQKIFETLF